MRHFDIVLDTNVVFAGLYSRSGASGELIRRFGGQDFYLHVSVPLLFEYEEVLKSNSEKLGLTIGDVDDFLDYICLVAHTQTLWYSWRPCLNDPDDEMLLELAVAAQCDYIVTHNVRDFRMVRGFSVRAILPGDFLNLLED
jgi:putative PIN family toxin of toxin-antitoxin system